MDDALEIKFKTCCCSLSLCTALLLSGGNVEKCMFCVNDGETKIERFILFSRLS